jgi:hypothetical protein
VSRLGDTTTPVSTGWSAADSCGIAGYALARSTNGGAWATQTLASGLARSVVQPLTFGSSDRYRVRAVDGAGNTSGWSYGPTFRPLLSQQSAAAVSYHGTWHTVSNSYASGGTIAYSTASAASATFVFSGYAVSWVAYRGPNRGSAAVYVDGVYKATVNLHSATYHARQIVYATHWSQSGSHSLRIVNLGTAGHSRVDVDAFVRLGPS